MRRGSRRATGNVVAPADDPRRAATPHGTFLLLLVPALCCGAPLLLAAVAATGLGAWLAANRPAVAASLALAAAWFCIGLWIYQHRRLMR